MNTDKIICIFGGAGFVGRYVTQDLARAGYRIKIATRIPESAYELKTYGNVGQITPFLCNYNDPKEIQSAIKGCYGVINLIGILFEKGKNNFKRAHIEIPQTIASACKKEGVKKFIHVSSLGVNKAQSRYARSKAQGEEVIRKEYPAVTIMRPSVIFGAGDNFFNMFSKLAVFLPALPLIGGGKTKFQPVFVGDVAEAIKNVMVSKDEQYVGKTYELGGPETVTFKEIYKILLKEINRDKALISIPWTVAKIQGSILSLMPKPLLTRDQVTSLQTDSVVADEALTLSDLGVDATAMETILPKYLACYKRGGRFGDKKAA